MAKLTLDEYTLYFGEQLLAWYTLGNFAEDMDFDVFCLESWNDYYTCIH